jgi:DNA-binding transcriptional LysR family regulator
MIDDRGSTAGVPDRWLRVFLAVVETGSFTHAGRALGIGQPAVSHAIKQLENALGAPLFERGSGRASLTAPGQHLAAGLRSGFEAIDQAVRTFRLHRGHNSVELSVSMPLATYWLMPRLADFRALHPDVELRVTTMDTDRLIGVDDADLWIPRGLGDWHDLEPAVFCEERVYPVAAPAHPLARPDTPPEALLDAELLNHDHHDRFGWEAWFARHRLPAPAPASLPRFSDYALVVRAAIAGQGVALGWHHLVKDLIADGVLSQVGDCDVATDHPLVVLARPEALHRVAVLALRDWLTSSAAADWPHGL